MNGQTLSLFEAYGIEIEYMIVSKETLDVAFIADKLLHTENNSSGDVERGLMGWSNELMNHLIEIKCLKPQPLEGQATAVAAEVVAINRHLDKLGARLMPTGMHPWMDPKTQFALWPHESSTIYQAFDQVFNCHKHGWANVQSTHLNLPYANDAEFGALHAAIRLLLPILPALAASSPLTDGKMIGVADGRLQALRETSMQVPSALGKIIPEPVYTRKDYEMNILAKIYQDLSPYDPDNILQHEWVNARGVIPRFARGSLEIRLLDVQECPNADIAIMMAIVGVLKALVAQRWVAEAEQKAWATPKLVEILNQCINKGHEAVIDDERYLRAFNFNSGNQATAQELWQHLVGNMNKSSGHNQDAWHDSLDLILQQGPLSRRIARALGRDVSREHQKDVYQDLCECLAQNKSFRM